MKKTKHFITLAVVAVLWAVLTVLCIVKPAVDVSISERRKLEQFPELSVETIGSGKFMSKFETYTLDQFPLRDLFRQIKAISTYYLYGQKDNNDIYLVDGYASKLEYPLKENLIIGAADKFELLYDSYLSNAGEIYYAVIPDKNYFLAEANGYPAMDYDRLYALMQENMPFAEEIDIRDTLEITDYYKTDTHWRQECIVAAAQALAKSLGVYDVIDWEYEKKSLDTDFYGVYYGQAALPMPSEKMYYLTNSAIEGCTVFNFETGKTTGIYNFDKLSGYDPYEFYLSGAAALLYVENPDAATDRELVVFRDSFASSIIPLLSQAYSKITLVDTRYIMPQLLGDYVDFDGADVLYLYSTLILNSSSTLK